MIVVLLLTLIHILFWLFFIFGGFFSKKFCQINLYIILPLIYLIHTIMPFHIIVNKKIEIINNNYDNLIKNLDLNKVSENELNFMKQDIPFQKQISHIKEDRKDNITKIYILEENKLILPLIQRKIRLIFSNSFADPLSAQGMVILGCIINVYLMNRD
jgi:hypothetical protein